MFLKQYLEVPPYRILRASCYSSIVLALLGFVGIVRLVLQYRWIIYDMIILVRITLQYIFVLILMSTVGEISDR